MTNADWWLRVRQQRAAVQPRQATDVELWRLTKGAHIAEAVVRLIDGLGTDLRYLHNGDLRESRVYRDDAQLQATAAAKRNDLLAKGWVDPGSLAWGR